MKNNTRENLEKILSHFNLIQHPEGGAFSETYRCSMHETFPHFDGERSVSTAIYFLLKEGEKSHLHRIKSDEIWHFYLGGPLEIIEITPKGDLSKTILGQDFMAGEKLQYVVQAGNWFGATPLSGSLFSFVGCTVAPGFDYRDFELASRQKLLQLYPQHPNVITQLTSLID